MIRQVVIVAERAETVRELEHALPGRGAGVAATTATAAAASAVVAPGEQACPAVRQTDACNKMRGTIVIGLSLSMTLRRYTLGAFFPEFELLVFGTVI